MMLLNGTLRRTYISYESHAQYGQKAVDIMTDMLGEDYYTGDGYWNNYESWYSWLAHRSANDEDNKFVWMYYYGKMCIRDRIDPGGWNLCVAECRYPFALSYLFQYRRTACVS